MTKGNENGRSVVTEDCPGGSPDNLYAVIDNPVDGYVFCSGSVDDVRTYLRENGDGGIFCRVRVFTLH